jgi:GalNAc-alpha-(1->4)-GalNAc-alpha-(1->3)-diNAcBac-PP-undecaprenol alpha-1,4-N-acetyl-D-galactosaminyltransferase
MNERLARIGNLPPRNEGMCELSSKEDLTAPLRFRVIFTARKFADVAGGLERICIDLMNALVGRGHSVALMTWDHAAAKTHYPLDGRVQWFKLDIGDADVTAGLRIKAARLRRFRGFVASFDPHAIVGFQSGAALFSRVATIGMGKKIVAAERVSPDMWRYVRTRFVDRMNDIYSLVLADRVTVQFPEYIDKYPRILRRKMVAIHNPVHRSKPVQNVVDVGNSQVLLYVARLCFQKNQKMLIEAFARICERFPDWKLVLVGDGEYAKLLRAKVSEMRLDERVVFCGAVKNVEAWYQAAQLVAFPSLFEGFPNSLAESLAWGLPCVGLKNTLGVNALIEDGVNGVLTHDDAEDFSAGLAALMGDKPRREWMGQNAKRISEAYPPEHSYSLWEALITEVVSCRA